MAIVITGVLTLVLLGVIISAWIKLDALERMSKREASQQHRDEEDES